jgi:hypothetical protein
MSGLSLVALTFKMISAVVTEYRSDRSLVGTHRAFFGSVCNLVATTVAEPGSGYDFGSAV